MSATRNCRCREEKNIIASSCRIRIEVRLRAVVDRKRGNASIRGHRSVEPDLLPTELKSVVVAGSTAPVIVVVVCSGLSVEIAPAPDVIELVRPSSGCVVIDAGCGGSV